MREKGLQKTEESINHMMFLLSHRLDLEKSEGEAVKWEGGQRANVICGNSVHCSHCLVDA